MRILIVEDNRDTALTLKVLLERAGHSVKVAFNGVTGVAVALAEPPDVVLCDLGLPEMDGFAVARELSSSPATSGARLIAISGYGEEAARRRSREAGFELHLTKPVDPSQLQRILLAG
jgi:CheY-like chemotaxis protein